MHPRIFTLIRNGELYRPEPTGKEDLLLVGNRIAKIGDIDERALARLDVEVSVVDANGGLVTPGFIDPHEHLLGGSGERGFGSQTPEIALAEIVSAGITTVVGCLGVDTTMKTMPGLLARAKALREAGISSFIYSGGYDVPPSTLTSSIRNDLLYIEEVIGAGEIAVADRRSVEPSPRDLAKLVSDAFVGGMLSRKAGVTHFHVGEGSERLSLLRTLLDDFEIHPGSLYPTHVQRTEELMREAIALTQRGVTVDIDTVEEDLPKWVTFFLREGGVPGRLTVSSDASIMSPRTLTDQVRACVSEVGLPLELLLPFVTSNTARVLRLPEKGSLNVGMDADVAILDRTSFDLVHCFARGELMVHDGRVCRSESWTETSNREVHFAGAKRPENAAT